MKNTSSFNKYLFSFVLFIFTVIGIIRILRSSETGPYSLDVRGASADIVASSSGELLKGDKAVGTFHSKFPFLGVITIRFDNWGRDSNDILMFRIREKGQPDWYYQASYKTDQFLPHKHFPFGFPVIANSNGKDYVFEIESLEGKTGSGIIIDRQNPVFIARSRFLKSQLLNDKKILIYFLSNKLINMFSDGDTIFYVFTYFLPILFYYLFLVSEGISYQFLSLFVISLAFFDIYRVEHNYIYFWLSTMLLWFLAVFRHKLESRITAGIGMLFLSLVPIYLFSKQEIYAEKSAIWAILFFSATAVQQIIYIKKPLKYELSIRYFIYNLKNIELDLKHKFAKFVYHSKKPLAYILSIYFIFLTFKKELFALEKYREFFIDNPTFRYITSTLAPSLVPITIIILYVLYLRKKRTLHYIYLLILSFVLMTMVNSVINGTTKFIYIPKILHVSPQSVSDAWVDVQIQGKNFRDLPFVGEVVLNGIPQRIVDWTNERVIFRTDPYISKTGPLQIRPMDKDATNLIQFVYEH